ncbi:MAG: 50S ribosomal protein L4 [Atopobiaceae bacterium]|nr:50S ribosomal protein L4 [Atopobiaceae bacterium]MBQ3283208.1 50S ribosomal protein L4 [Atopobiaceae bacterium]MBQ6651093.1 50S ribosomal protein L4 [Atopobiaceae bacterium]
MSQIDIRNAEGEVARTIELADSVFGIEPNIPVIHQVVVCQAASMRQGTHSVKNRHDVSGGGKKPYRQKGTGRARQGSTRAGQWTGGGVIFGPTPRSHARRTNAKEVKLAMRGILSGKLRDSELFVVDEFAFDEPSTKQAAALLKALEVEGKRVTVVVADDDINTYLSFRNMPKVNVIGIGEACAGNLIDNAALVMTEDIAKQLEEVLA